MSTRLPAALLGALGGLLLTAGGGLSFLSHEAHDWHGWLATAGYAAAVAALVVIGYGMVARAPVWLRTIVSVAMPLLLASVWQVVDQAINERVDGWKGPATVHFLAGLITLVAALVEFRLTGRDRDAAYTPSHHR
jgi:hypothetical protein